jgi:hypothetical protein
VETGESLELTFDETARARYTAAFDENAEAIRRIALRNRGRYAAMPTNVNLEEAVFSALSSTVPAGVR